MAEFDNSPSTARPEFHKDFAVGVAIFHIVGGALASASCVARMLPLKKN